MFDRKELKRQAKQLFNQNSGVIIFVLLICFGLAMLSEILSQKIFKSNIFTTSTFFVFTLIFSTIVNTMINYMMLFFFIDLVDNGKGSISSLSKVFQKQYIAKVIFLGLIVSCIEFIGFILLIIPGLIASTLFAPVPYFVYKHPEKNIKEILQMSVNMMTGHLLEYWTLLLTFFGWWLFVICTLGLGLLYVYPYQILTLLLYFDTLYKQKEMVAER